jgi:long-chain fatty acid transport protein
MRGNLKSGLCRAALVAAALGGLMDRAEAGGFGLNEYSAASIGMANAGAPAGAGGLGSIAWNPATMTDFAGFQMSSTGTWIGPGATITPSAGTAAAYTALGMSAGKTGDVGDGGRFAPASQVSYQFNDRLWFGLSLGAPFGLSTIIRPTAAASYYGTDSQLVDVNVTPTVAYKVNDWLSVGAGLQISYISVLLDSQIPRTSAIAHIRGDSWGVGYTLGATLKPREGTEIGVGYRSRVFEDVSGVLSNGSAIPRLGGGAILPGSRSASTTLVLPDQINVGVHQVLTDRLGVGLTYQWTNWGLFNRFILKDSVGVPLVALNFGYKNSWLVSGGFDYKPFDRAVLRVGLGYEQSPVTDAVRSVRVPDNDRVIVAVGAGYQLSEKINVDVAYSHFFVKTASINTAGAIPALNFVGTSKGQVDIVSASLTYRFDAPQTQIVAAKY